MLVSQPTLVPLGRAGDVLGEDAASQRHLFPLQSMKLDRHSTIGFQEFHQLEIRPFQLVLLREKAKQSNNANNLAAGFQNYASGQVLLVGQKRRFWLTLAVQAHSLL